MSGKRFSLLNAVSDFQAVSAGGPLNQNLDFDLCFICQEQTKEQLICPALNSTLSDKTSGYLNIVKQLEQFHAIGELPDAISSKIDFQSEHFVQKLVSNNAKFHKKCRSKYDKHHYERVSNRKRKHPADSASHVDFSSPSTRARYSAENFQ